MMFLALLLSASAVAFPPQVARARVAFDGDRIVAARAHGLADRAKRRRVRADDPVRIASISKLAVALGVMRLVEARKLDLDRDVSAYLGWTLRNPGFADTPVTLRQLLSHTAGVRDGAGYVLALDDDLPAHLTKTGAWDATHAPGSYFSYANLNFGIIAAVMEGATVERFDRLMARLVFTPLKIDTCFNWTTCSDRAVRRAVVLYRSTGVVAVDDLHGQRPACPGGAAKDGSCDLSRYTLARNGALFGPQGSMRIGMTDLARLGMVLSGEKLGFLSPPSLTVMTTPQWRYDGRNGDIEGGIFCGYGLGVMILALPGSPEGCRDDLFGDGRMRIGHAGEAYGLRSGLWIDPATRRGVAFFTSTVADDAPIGPRSAFNAVEEIMVAGGR
ncbi:MULTISPECIES: serine hydrolase domain-containing protein [unclassified Sphingomonas]|uniref:serine hydrolase domain-containing protein n=1 Tax=unclassified Sphingomonas TaxID=196159 RepID=UPI0026D1ECE5